MKELVKLRLNNEMDLILAHRRAMKLAELAGLSMSAQTSFATAVSEVSRVVIDKDGQSHLSLGIDDGPNERNLVAAVSHQLSRHSATDGLEYAKRLADKYHVKGDGGNQIIELYFAISPHAKIDTITIDLWRQVFRNEPSLSPYEELKNKAEQLQELSEKLTRSEAQFKTLTNSLPLIIFSMDREGLLLYANEWLYRLTGMALDELNRSQWKEVVHQEDYASFSVLFGNQLASAAAGLTAHARILSAERGEHLWHQLSITPLRSSEGKFISWIGYMADVHAQKQYEATLRDNRELKEMQERLRVQQENLERANRELNRSNEELKQFAFVASHDLQEPVRKVLYYSDFLLHQYAPQLDERGVTTLHNVRTASERMRNLIQDLLVYSQINKKEIRLQEVDLDEILKESLQDLELMINEKHATVEAGNLPSIPGDQRMLRQLFENLISNSIKYAHRGRNPHIRIKAEREEDQWVLSFRDNGIGFDEKYLPQMFTLFQRLHSRSSYEGTGLGLAICLKIVEFHNGRIWAQSAEGEGATFFVSLPVLQHEEQPSGQLAL